MQHRCEARHVPTRGSRSIQQHFPSESPHPASHSLSQSSSRVHLRSFSSISAIPPPRTCIKEHQSPTSVPLSLLLIRHFSLPTADLRFQTSYSSTLYPAHSFYSTSSYTHTLFTYIQLTHTHSKCLLHPTSTRLSSQLPSASMPPASIKHLPLVVS